jgi:hypothetical protein
LCPRFGLNIFGGSSSDSGDDDAYALFEAGVELASLGFFFMALVNISGSFFISGTQYMGPDKPKWFSRTHNEMVVFDTRLGV